MLTFPGSFSAVFVDQSFWQTGIAAKPVHSVWGFIVGGLVYFAVPFCSAYAFGMAYWALAIRDNNGQDFITTEDEEHGEQIRREYSDFKQES